MKVKSKNTGVKSHIKSLSIQFSLDGFSFCTQDLNSGDVILFTKYQFDRTLATPELLLEKVISIFSEDKNLQTDFKEINVIHQNHLSTLVPSLYFDQKELKSYLDFNIKTLANDYITFDSLNQIDAKNVYIPFVNINNYLFQNFGSFEFKHHSSILIDKLLNYSKNNTKRQFFVNVYKHTFDIVITEGAQLILHNSYTYQNKEDFIYYILFVSELLERDTNELQLIFLGDIDKNDEYYQITYTYIRNVEFIKPNSNFFNNDDEFNDYSNYILV